MKQAKIEKDFDINIVLMMAYSALESVREDKNMEIIYDVDSTVPKELKGDPDTLAHLLTHLLRFVISHNDAANVIVRIVAPEDFLYLEEVTFSVDTSTTDITPQKAQHFFDTRLKKLLDRLEARAEYDAENDRIVIHVPFKLKDLGNRRYYRLPDIRMLGKKVLLICKNKEVARSIKKMFRYFLYEVDEGAEEYKKRGSNLAYYDIFVLDRELVNDGILQLAKKVQMQQDLKFVILDDSNYTQHSSMERGVVSAYLVKPVMQESIYDLIVALYEEDSKSKRIVMKQNKPVIDMGNYIDDAFKRSEEAVSRMVKNEKNQGFEEVQGEDFFELRSLPVLETKEGEKKARKIGFDYQEKLKEFIDKFNRSDYYFREIVRSKSEWQMKEFATDLEKESSLIGATRMAALAKMMSTYYVYRQWDKLKPVVPRYHAELKELIMTITHYLKRSTSSRS